MTDLRDRLLDRMQSAFPIEPSPYEVLADGAGASAEDVYAEVGQMEAEGLLRRIGASFSSAKLGYRSVLCALSVDEDRIDDVTAAVDACPNVTHDYIRDDEYNVWFTLIAGDEVELLTLYEGFASLEGVQGSLYLPSTRMFKVRVDFSEMGKGTRGSVNAHQPSSQQVERGEVHLFDPSSPFDVELVRVFQEDILGYGMEPYAAAAGMISEAVGERYDELELIERLRRLKANGTIRRFGAMVRHHALGFGSNAMTVWDVPEDISPEVGRAFATHPEVSHCYERCSDAEWPFDLYAMVHARSEDQLLAMIGTLESEAAGIVGEAVPMRALRTVRESKKASMRYFEDGD